MNNQDVYDACKNCICKECVKTMWDGNGSDCFTCEYCINGDRKKEKKEECKSYETI